MSSVAVDTVARDWTRRLERAEASRTGLPIEDARKRVARRLGVLPGTLENIGKGRIKGIRNWVAQKIRQAVIREIEAEIARLQHELEMARRCGTRLDSELVGEIETHLAAVSALLDGGGK